MLLALAGHSGLDRYFTATLSVHENRAYKLDPRAYQTVQEHLGVPPDAVAFVSSNGSDVAGAEASGFKVIRVEHLTKAALHVEIAGLAASRPAFLFKALRTQTEAIGSRADITLATLNDLPEAITALQLE